MPNSSVVQEITTLVTPMAEAAGLSVWGVEMATGDSGNILRIYIESEEGVTIAQCAKLSRDLSVILEVEDIVPGRYNLEVSSPGLNRPFFSPEQMKAYVGSDVQAVLNEHMEGRKKFSGKLKEVTDTTYRVEVDGEQVTLNFDETRKVNLRYNFPAKGKKA